MSVGLVGEVATLLDRLCRAARGGPVALGVDFPIGLPRAYAALHARGAVDFPGFLLSLADCPEFLDVAESLDQVHPARPFYPRRGARGMTRLSHAQALGLATADGLSRQCDRATSERPAGAPLFWTLGANQTGKAAIAAWQDMLLPSLRSSRRPAIWPFDDRFVALLQPGRVAIAETYPAEALRQLGLRPVGSKRRQEDRAALIPDLRAAMGRLDAIPDRALGRLLDDGMGADAAGEDRLDCLLGVLCVLLVVSGSRPDTAPPDPWIQRWEGWVLGQSPPLSLDRAPPPAPGLASTRPTDPGSALPRLPPAPFPAER